MSILSSVQRPKKKVDSTTIWTPYVGGDEKDRDPSNKLAGQSVPHSRKKANPEGKHCRASLLTHGNMRGFSSYPYDAVSGLIVAKDGLAAAAENIVQMQVIASLLDKKID